MKKSLPEIKVVIAKGIIVSMLGLILTGCVATAKNPSLVSGKAACLASGKWYDPMNARQLNSGQVLAKAVDSRVVLLGETHTMVDHHRWQLHTLAALHDRNPDIVLGFEAFPRKAQPVLDQWVAGKLSEAELLKQTEWFKVWKYDPAMYRPLFHVARLHRLPMVALNVERSLVSTVRKHGWDGVALDKREGVSTPAAAPEPLKKRLAIVYAQHMKGFKPEADKNNAEASKSVDLNEVMKNDGFKGFVNSMLVWDRAMAEALANASKGDSTALVVGIVGTGHLEYTDSIPYQLADLGINNVTVLLPWNDDIPCFELTSENGVAIADAVFALDPLPIIEAPEKPRLGVMIEAVDKGVRVSKVVADSIAKETGLLEGDIITRAAGVSIHKVHGLVQIISRQAPGTWLPLMVLRDGKKINLIAKFPTVNPHKKPL